MATIIDELLDFKNLIDNPENIIRREQDRIVSRINQALASSIPTGSRPEIMKSFEKILSDIDYGAGRKDVTTGIKLLISDILDAQHCNGKVSQAYSNMTPRTRPAASWGKSVGESSSESGGDSWNRLNGTSGGESSSGSSVRCRPTYSGGESGESGFSESY